MKHKVSLLFLMYFCLTYLCFAGINAPKGAAQCRLVENLCREAGVTPTQSALVTSVNEHQSDFPFNITLDFPASSDNLPLQKVVVQEKFLIILSQEDCMEKPDLFTNLLSILSAQNLNYDIKILLSYGEKTSISGFQVVSGIEEYMKKLENPQDYAVLILSLCSDKTKVISGSGNMVSPSWIVKNAYDSINKNRLLTSFESSYISFSYKHNLYQDDKLEFFLKAGLPAIHVFLNKDMDLEMAGNFFKDFLILGEEEAGFSLDNHSIMVTFFHHSLWINEKNITRLILFTIFLSFFLLATYTFINGSSRFQAWRHIKEIWFYPGLIYIISLAIFFGYRFLEEILRAKGINIPVYISICIILPMNLAVISYAFIAALKYSPVFKRRTVDFLTLICSSMNLILFPLYDITLFPIFAVEFILAWLSTIFTRNIFHILILILFEIPFLPFIMHVFNTADPVLLQKTITGNWFLVPALYFLLLPQYLSCFRVFTGINFYWLDKKIAGMSTDRKNILIMAIFLGAFEIILSIILPPSLKQNYSSIPETVIMESPESFITAKVETEEVFGDTISKVEITSQIPLFLCNVEISGNNATPILFSDYDYILENSKTSVFRLPQYPPQKLSFAYGTNPQENEYIIITGVYEDEGVLYSQKVILQATFAESN